MTDITVGTKVEYLLPENTTIGGQTIFDAEVTAVHEDGTADLKFLPYDATQEYVEHARVVQGIGFGQFRVLSEESEEPVDGEAPVDGGV